VSYLISHIRTLDRKIEGTTHPPVAPRLAPDVPEPDPVRGPLSQMLEPRAAAATPIAYLEPRLLKALVNDTLGHAAGDHAESRSSPAGRLMRAGDTLPA